MNLAELFRIQKKLDERIVKEHGLEGQDLLDKKILALQVEIGELANEARFFKFWSKDQEPRTIEHKFSRSVDNLGNIEPPKNPLLEEYVDVLHFILSIGNDLKITNVAIDSDYTSNTATETFNDMFLAATSLLYEIENRSRFEVTTTYKAMFNLFIGLGERYLGFTTDQIEQAYMDKNKINHARQDNSY